MALAEPSGICFASAIDFNTFIYCSRFSGDTNFCFQGVPIFAGSYRACCGRFEKRPYKSVHTKASIQKRPYCTSMQQVPAIYRFFGWMLSRYWTENMT